MHLPRLRRLVMVTLAFAVSACSEPPPPEAPPRLVRAMRIADSDGLSERSFPGKAKAAQQATLSFRVSGQVLELPIDVGDQLTEGALLARLDPADFESALGTARSALAETDAAVEKAAADYRRSTNVQQQDPGAISQRAVDRAKAARDASVAVQSGAQAAVKLAENRLSYTRLVAPFGGEVAAKYVEAFETVVAKQPVARLLDRSGIEFVVDIPETLISYADRVQEVVVRFDANPNRDIPAKISEIGREAAQGTRTYPMTLVLNQPDDFDILPGMAGKAFITALLPGDAVEGGIDVPAAALFSRGDPQKSYIWVIVDNQLQQREVTVGRPSDFGVRIRSGVAPGEWIVTRGVNALQEGQRVRIADDLEQPAS